MGDHREGDDLISGTQSSHGGRHGPCPLLADFVAEVGDDDGVATARTRLMLLFGLCGPASGKVLPAPVNYTVVRQSTAVRPAAVVLPF